MSKKTALNNISFISCIGLLLMLQIAGMAFGNTRFWITPDEANYLRFASSQSFAVTDVFGEQGQSHFSVWPMGYPMLIRFFDSFLPFDILLSALLVNFLTIIGCCIFFWRYFQEKALPYMLVFLSLPFILVTYKAWSETLFTVCLILFAISLHEYYKKQTKTWLCCIFVLLVFSFLSRYIAVFLFAPLGFLFLTLLWQKNYKSCFAIIGTSALALSLITFYLWINYTITGHLSGIERASNQDSLLSLLHLSFLSIAYLIKELAIVGLGLFILTQAFPKKQSKKSKRKEVSSVWIFFLLVGFFYFKAFIALRYLYHFDDPNYRLLMPFTALTLMGCVNFFLQYKNLHKYIYIVLLVTTFYNIANIYIQRAPLSNAEKVIQNWTDKRALYASIPDKSIILFGQLDLTYYNSAIQPEAPFPYYGEMISGHDFVHNYSKRKNIENHAETFCHGTTAKHIFLDTYYLPEIIDRFETDTEPKKAAFTDSLKKYLSEEKSERIVKIKDCLSP